MSTPRDDNGDEVEPTYEVVISCTRYVFAQTEIKTRILACGLSLLNARDLGEWMHALSHAIFNFSLRYSTSVASQRLCTDIVTSACPLDMDIDLQSFTIPCFPSLMVTMSRPAYHAVLECSSLTPVIAFFPLGNTVLFRVWSVPVLVATSNIVTNLIFF